MHDLSLPSPHHEESSTPSGLKVERENQTFDFVSSATPGPFDFETNTSRFPITEVERSDEPVPHAHLRSPIAHQDTRTHTCAPAVVKGLFSRSTQARAEDSSSGHSRIKAIKSEFNAMNNDNERELNSKEESSRVSHCPLFRS